ncbi:MAG: hypothetical protein PHV63_03440 [Candidatus Daviesbacteria bacterium]|nr:hypothetical protein [Candidatus Daviesbacteria bacterium]
MVNFKKLIFAPLFLISFLTLIYLTTPLFRSYDFIFSLSLNTLITLIYISVLISFSSLLFILLATIAEDWRISLSAAIIGSATTFVFMDPAFAVIFAVAIFISFLLSNLSLDVALKSYLNFQPSNLLGPSIRYLSGLLILTICIVYFFSTSKIIAQQGFQIPDTLIDTALKLTPLPQSTNQTEQTNLSQLSPEQLDLLKKNPELLRQSGLDPKILESLTNPKKITQPQASLTNDLIKQTVKDQIQNFIKPYTNFIPAGLAVLLFFTLQFFTSILNLLIYPLLWLTFFILEKTGFIKFEVEQRTVRKMVI